MQADLKTFAALGVHGACAVTAVTAQNTLGTAAVHPVPPEMVGRQIATVLDDLEVSAVKTGMLVSAATVEAVAGALARRVPALVVDPVLVSRTGARIVDDAMIAALKRRLLPAAAVLTPNLDEAAILTGLPVAATAEALAAQSRALLEMGAAAVVLKDGRGRGSQARDLVLIRGAEPFALAYPRVATRNNHGTGCTLAAAIAAHLARGAGTEAAIRAARSYVAGAIAAADRLGIGHGHGPVHHFHRLWPEADDD
jgi:hydroxymethylpyrimidine/phosphomethylpyrimidine kinase